MQEPRSEEYDEMIAVVKKAGLLPEPRLVYVGVDDEVLDLLIEAAGEEDTIEFDSLLSTTLDPEVALKPGINTLLVIEAKTGLEIPGDELEVLQAGTRYKITDWTKSDPDEEGNVLNIFYLDEVVDEQVNEPNKV